VGAEGAVNNCKQLYVKALTQLKGRAWEIQKVESSKKIRYKNRTIYWNKGNVMYSLTTIKKIG
jgi:hypothetical protein